MGWKARLPNAQSFALVGLAQKDLAAIALNASLKAEIRSSAVLKLNYDSEPEAIDRLALDKKERYSVRIDAVVKMGDQDKIGAMALDKMENQYLRRQAVKKLKDQNLLRQIAGDKAEILIIREPAIRKLQVVDMALLNEIAFHEPEEQLRNDAKGRIKELLERGPILTPEQREQAIKERRRLGMLARGQVPYVEAKGADPSELEYLVKLCSEKRHETGRNKGFPDFETIAVLINQKYHEGKTVRHPSGLSATFAKAKKSMLKIREQTKTD